MRAKTPILSLVFEDPFGRTIVGSVKDKLHKTKGVWHFSKSRPNGSDEANSVLALRGIEPGRATIDICGFFTDMCVLQTATGLKKMGHKIVVHEAGTGALNISDHNSGIRRMKRTGIEIRYEDNTIG